MGHTTTGEGRGALPLAGGRPEWQQHAACRGMAHQEGYGRFFPERGADTEPAKTICAQCPVQAECRDFGLEEYAGIWGGLSARQRKAERARRDDTARRVA